MIIELNRKEADLFQVLIERPEEAISAEELLREVWQGRPREKNIIYVLVHNLRSALRLAGSGHEIRTAYGRRGYMLHLDHPLPRREENLQ